ncbi:MAG: NAD(P)-dependent glycerol-3-phosphate dehydrogenase [Phycisphaerae bacterium]|nr:NAD(P)-dependent glycerol-3-phosphate dehydrogenase [Phycisphaerae bacterium]
MAERITVIGDGAMGTVCAIMLCENGHDVTIWSAFDAAAAEMAQARENRKFLPGYRLPENMDVTSDESKAFDRAELVISAVPTQFIRPVWKRLARHYKQPAAICSVAKGIENGTLLRPSEILSDVLGAAGRQVGQLAVLSGPSIAPEIADKLPATVAVAATDRQLPGRIQACFTRPYFRIYTNEDMIGMEIAGATKNVIAIAAGILDGLQAGDNAKAALLARGLAEITRLALAMGARADTLAGLAGVGDLVTTCISPHGRNRSFGQAIGEGQSVSDALGAGNSVVEGAATTRSVVQLAANIGVDMPITQAVYDVLFSDESPADAITALMLRPPRAEG